jgi:transcriptional regulator NrdR family protein
MAAKTKNIKSTKKRKFSARHVVKRRGHHEAFDARKVYGSVLYACFAAHVKEKAAEKIALSVSDDIAKLVEKSHSITAHEIFYEVTKRMKKHHAEAAFMYETHRDVC